MARSQSNTTQRENIRRVNKYNSFYDVFTPRTYKDNQEYKIVAGIAKAIFSKGK